MNTHETMDPVTEFLLEYNLTMPDLARNAGVTVQVVRRATQGLFGHLPPSLEIVMKGVDPETDWHGKYEQFLDNVEPFELPPPVGRFLDWRYSISASRLEFCRKFKIQPVIISNYESGTTQHMPKILWDRLAKMKGREYADAVAGLPVR